MAAPKPTKEISTFSKASLDFELKRRFTYSNAPPQPIPGRGLETKMSAIAFGFPRSTTRTGYASVRDHKRSSELTREERGLPLHPANDFIACPDCEGTGEHTRNDSAIGDPQCEYGVDCGRCSGQGEIADGLIDPLLLVAKYRKGRFSWAMTAIRKAERLHYYRLYRMRAMRHCAGLDQVDMLFQLHQCGNELERSIASWKAVAA